MCVGPAAFDRAHGGHAHDRVAEPVAGADEDAEGLERILNSREPAFVGREEKLRLRGFPAVVDPEPVFGPVADLGFEHWVEADGDGVGVFARGRHGWLDDAAPAGHAVGVDGGGDEPCAGAQGERGGERGGGGETVEEGTPEPGVAGVLIHEDADGSAFAHELSGFDETRLALEKLEPEPRAVAADFGVDVGIAQRLEDGADFAAEKNGRELGEHFPTADVADDHDEAAADRVAGLQSLQPLDSDDGADFVRRERGQFDVGEDVRTERGEMFSRQRTQFGGGFFAAESDGQIVQDEPAVGRCDPVSKSPERPSDAEDRGQRQRAEQRGKGAVDRKDDAIHQAAELHFKTRVIPSGV